MDTLASQRHPTIVRISIKVVHDSIFTVGASVSPSKPLLDATRVEPVEAWENHIFFFKLILAHANRARLIFLREVCPVSLSEVGYRKRLEYCLRNWLHYVVVKIKECLIVVEVAECISPINYLINDSSLIFSNVVIWSIWNIIFILVITGIVNLSWPAKGEGKEPSPSEIDTYLVAVPLLVI